MEFMDKHLLSKTAAAMVAKGKGLLAADESSGTCETRFKTIGVACTEDSRREYRGLLITAPGAEQFISGVILGIVPIFAIGSNGFGLGVLFGQASEASGYLKAGLKVLPYGVFEIPALLIAASYGLWLGVMVVRRMRGKEGTLLRSNMEHAFRRYFAVVFPLLIVAAAIETALILWLP